MIANDNFSDELSITFIKHGTHLWDKSFLENTISVLKKYQSHGNEISNERCFTEFLLEFEQAYRVFLKKINDLPMMMKCRVKGDNQAHFGGQECAELARSLRTSAERYLKSTYFKKSGSDNNIAQSHVGNTVDNGPYNARCTAYSVYDYISKIKNMAREDEKAAKEIEARVYQEYVSCGKDNTLDMLKQAGYTFNDFSI